MIGWINIIHILWNFFLLFREESPPTNRILEGEMPLKTVSRQIAFAWLAQSSMLFTVIMLILTWIYLSMNHGDCQWLREHQACFYLKMRCPEKAYSRSQAAKHTGWFMTSVPEALISEKRFPGILNSIEESLRRVFMGWERNLF